MTTSTTAITLLLLLTIACNVPGKGGLPKEKEHPKLIKNIGNGNVQCSLQDKAGNLWFGTSDDGLYKYDGKSFSRENGLLIIQNINNRLQRTNK